MRVIIFSVLFYALIGSYTSAFATNEFSTIGISGLMDDDVQNSIHRSSFCNQYSVRVFSSDNKKSLNAILKETPNLYELPKYSYEGYESVSVVLSKKSNSLVVFSGKYIDLRCEDITSDGKPELFVSINYAGGNASVIQYIFSTNKLNLMLNTSEAGVTWWDGGLHQKMEDLNGDGIKEYNGWSDSWIFLGSCSACRVPPRKIMCLDGKSYSDCTTKFPEILQKDFDESLEKLRSPSDYLKNNIDAYLTELLFLIATSINILLP